MNECLLSLVHEKDKFNGTAELLDILASIISGYAVPIRQEHITFFETILIPMHKVQSSPEFYEQLLRCTMLFAIKDNNLCVTILEGLLKFWPFANRTKECLFLTSVYEALTACNPETIKHLVPRLFKRIVKCVSSNDVQVADRALCLWENSEFLEVMKMYREVTYPIIVPAIEGLGKKHWLPSLE